MEQIEGLFAVLIENDRAAFVEGPWGYEEAIEEYHLLVEEYAGIETKVRLIKITFLD